MALFEKKYTNKIYLDDTIELTSVIENARTIDSHTEYVIRVQRGPLPDNYWRVNHRYNDFVQLNNALSISGIDLPLPPKKIIGNMDAEFVAQRKIYLQNYLNTILMNPILASSLPMKHFLDPNNYTAPLHEIALQQVSLALRNDANFEIGKPIVDMGWRLRKHYYTVKNRQNPKQELILSWVEFGPDKHLQDKDMQNVYKSLGNLKHNNIESMVHQHVTENGALTIRNFYQNGTLRDILCCTKPKQQFIKKYGNPKQTKTLTITEISMYGYQILQALCYIYDKGLRYGHLHTGNILLTSNGIKLLDIENGLLGLPAFYRPYVVQRRKLHATTQVDVYSFGHVLYEMTFGRPLLEATCHDLSHHDDKLKNLLEIILSPDTIKQDLPIFTKLIEHPFFDDAKKITLSGCSIEKPYFKLSNHLKDVLLEAASKAEQRLKDEQKVARHQKKLVKVQEMMSSEEEMKKRKQKLKKEQKLAQEKNSTSTSNKISINESKKSNGKNSERSESPTSTSTTTSIGTPTPPFGSTDHGIRKNNNKNSKINKNICPPAPPLPQSSLKTTNIPLNSTKDRSALLGSICDFNKSKLRKINN